MDWITSYLSKRQQYAKMDDVTSECMEIACGVPQGSVLCPALFNMYINDIFQVSKILKLILIADDTILFHSGNDFNEIINIMNDELSKLKKVRNNNKLSLNIEKTKVMIFGNYENKVIKMYDVIIENVKEI